MAETVAVIGANSFAGADLVDLLLTTTDYAVAGIGRTPDPSPLFVRPKTIAERQRYGYYPLDLNYEMRKLLVLFDSLRPEYIVNFACLSEVAQSWDAPGDWMQTNVVALANLINDLRRTSGTY